MQTVAEFADRIRDAAGAGTPLRIRGGGTKDFYGREPAGDVLDTRDFAGIVAYEPTELFLTARAGTPLVEVEAVLAAAGQMLAFEPPHFAGTGSSGRVATAGEGSAATSGRGATVGGVVAAGLSGPRRMQVGAVRDFVLGARIVDGSGQELSFGGQVMKNVAGYDVSRLLAGSLGTLGLLVEVTLKVLPRPVAEKTLRFELSAADALDRLNAWGGRPLPISASCWHDGVLWLRLSGAGAAVAAARERLGGEVVADAEAGGLWHDVREQAHRFFAGPAPLWRLALPTIAPTGAGSALPGLPADDMLIEWGGGLRWLRTDADPGAIRAAAAAAGGHATLFRADQAMKAAAGVFQPLPAPLLTIHRRLKAAFDPRGIFNPGRLYPDF